MSQTAMQCLCAVLVCALATAAKDESQHTTPQAQVTRTMLHVARSLDPDLMETVSVRTRTGDIATLIVRKRGGKSSLVLPPPVSIMSSSINVLEEEEKREGKSEDIASSNIPASVTVRSSGFLTEEDNQRSGKSPEGVINIVAPPKHFHSSSSLAEFGKDYNEESSREKKTIYVPPPVYIRSSPMSIKGEQQRGENFWKRGRSVLHVDSDGIPVIHGVRMPDDESDRQTWRNARVINGILVPYEKPSNKIESEDKQEITRKATVHLEDPATNKKAAEGERPVKPFLYTDLSAEKKNQYNYPYDSDTHARIQEYINTVNQRENERRSNVPPRARMIRFNAARRSDDDGTGRSNSDSETQARVLHFPGSSIYPTSLLYTPPSAKTSRVSFEEGVRTPVLQYAHPELGVQPAKVMSKQDEVEDLEESKQDNRRADKDKTNALTLAYFAQDIHSDRSPYAYEPGLETKEEQPEVTTADSNTYKRSNNGEDDFSSQTSAKPLSKSSLAYLHESQSSDDSYGLGNDKYIKRYPYNGYNNVYSGPNKVSHNRYKGPISGAGYSKYPLGIGHYTIHAHAIQERPFWERIGDTIREHVQTSMEKVSDITRPVVEPLVEATHKISHNLGFASEDNRNVIQDKIGSTVAAYPVLLPALGLVAGGAALGLGAVAVGRYLDVDVMNRRIGLREDDTEELQVEHKRALDSIVKELNDRESAREGGTWVVAEEFKNPDEQKKVLESAFRVINDVQESSDQYDRRRKALETAAKNVRGKQEEWTVADDSIKQDDLKMIDDVIRSLKAPKLAAGDGTWVFVKNVNPREKARVQQTVNRQGVWSRVDDIRNMKDQEKETIESIVETLAEQEGIGHRQGSWIVTEQENEHANGRWMVDKDSITPNKRQIKMERSPDDKVIFLVEDDPKFQASKKISFEKTDLSNTQVRGERQLNQDILGQIGQKLTEGSVGNFHIVGNDRRLIKRSAQESTMSYDVPLHQLPVQSDHVISKRSSDDYHASYNKDGVIRLQDREQYLDNILHSLESSQKEILTTMATLDHRGDWSNTPCAKKIFCDVMVKQPADALMLMEKKMTTFLSLIQPNEVVSYHLSDVMDAVKRHDCSEFICPGAVGTPTFESGPR